MRRISRFILCNILGWKTNDAFPTDLKKYIIIVAPHTSWMDFPIGVLARNTYGLKGNYIGKHTLFKPPFGFIFRALGGTPVDRSKSANLVDAIVEIFNSRDEFILALSPEGTRKKLKKWKTGFYFVAQGAKVPIVMVGFDYQKKSITVAKPYHLTGDLKEDFNNFHAYFKNIKGKHPEKFESNFHLGPY